MEIELFRLAPALVLSEHGEDGVGERSMRGIIMRYDEPIPRSWGEMAFSPGSLPLGRWEGGRVPLLWSHRDDEPLGDVVETRADGSEVTAEFRISLASQRAREVVAMADSGMVTGLSPGVRPLSWDDSDAGVRVVTAADLVEVSLVSIPAVGEARVTALAVEEQVERLMERLRRVIG